MSFSGACFSQQTEDFRAVKSYFNQHRNLLSIQFKKKYIAEKNKSVKMGILEDYVLFKKKMDSIENVALIAALVKTKNAEDVHHFKATEKKADIKNVPAHTNDKTATYPGGIDALRNEVGKLFYSDAIYTESKSISTQVAFIVEKDGSISNVKAEGDNFTFNRQAEIALYSLSQKFSPAYINGDYVRYRFRLPLSFKIE